MVDPRKIAEARSAGYDDAAIADYLKGADPEFGVKVDAALQAGHTPTAVLDWLMENATPAAPPPQPDESTIGGEFVKGLKSGALLFPQAGLGAVRLAQDAVGADTTWTDEQLAGLAERQAAVAPAVGSFRDVDGFESGAKYVAHGFAQSVPMMAATMATGGVGAAVAGTAARGAIARGAVNLLGKETTKYVAKRQTLGAAAGAFAGSLPFEVGEIEAGQAEQGIHKPWKALAYATPATTLEVADDLLLLSKVPGIQLLKELPIFATKQGRGWFARSLQSAVEVAGVEGATEFVQTLLERGGADRSMLDAEAMEEALNGAILGATSGGIMGGAVGALPTKNANPGAQGSAPVDLLQPVDPEVLTPEEAAAADAAHAQGVGLRPTPRPGLPALPQGAIRLALPPGQGFEAPGLAPQTRPGEEPASLARGHTPYIEGQPPEAPPPPLVERPRSAIQLGPVGQQTYQEAVRRGATPGQAQQVAVEAEQEARRLAQFQQIPETAAMMQEEAAPQPQSPVVERPVAPPAQGMAAPEAAPVPVMEATMPPAPEPTMADAPAAPTETGGISTSSEQGGTAAGQPEAAEAPAPAALLEEPPKPKRAQDIAREKRAAAAKFQPNATVWVRHKDEVVRATVVSPQGGDVAVRIPQGKKMVAAKRPAAEVWTDEQAARDATGIKAVEPLDLDYLPAPGALDGVEAGALIRAGGDGEVIGRAASNSPAWFNSNPQGFTVKAAKNALAKAAAGEKLGPAQEAFVRRAIEMVRDEALAARGPERRVDTAKRKRIADMTPEERTRALMYDELTGLKSRRAYEDRLDELGGADVVFVMFDADSLKWVNDNLGHQAGDDLLRAVAQALGDANPGDAYRVGGDEFAFLGTDPDTVWENVGKAYAALDAQEVVYSRPDGTTFTSKPGVSYGIGYSAKEAEDGLKRSKSEREEQGLRAPRGEQPSGTVARTAAGREADLSAQTTPRQSTTELARQIAEEDALEAGGIQQDIFEGEALVGREPEQGVDDLGLFSGAPERSPTDKIARARDMDERQEEFTLFSLGENPIPGFGEWADAKLGPGVRAAMPRAQVSALRREYSAFYSEARAAQDAAEREAQRTLKSDAVKRIQNAIQAALQGLDVDLRLVESIAIMDVPGAKEAFAAHGITPYANETVPGMHQGATTLEGTARSIITLAFDSATEFVGYHELFHAAEFQGLISKADQAVLDRKYPATAKSGKETRADAYARWVTGARDMPALVQRVFARLKEMLERIGNTLRGLGYRSAADVFADLESGRLAERGPVTAPGALAVNYSLAEDTDPDAKPARRSLRERAHGFLDRLDAVVASPLLSLEQVEKLYSLRMRLQGRYSEIGDKTTELFRAFRNASGADAKAIYDFVTTRDADPATVPEAWRQQAVDAKRTIENIGDQLVEPYGLLPQDVVDANRGEYLPRVYLKHLLGEDAASTVGTGKGLTSMGYAKARQKLSEEQRIAYGEIKDPAYLLSRAYSLPMRDMATIDYLSEIAKNPAWVARGWLTEWAWDENARGKIGPWRYTVNADGTFDLSRMQRSRQVFTHTVANADLETFFGSAVAARALRAGKGKEAQRKTGTTAAGRPTFVGTGWKRYGKWYQYKKNADGSFTIKATELVEREISATNIAEAGLAKVVGAERAEAILERQDEALRVELDPADWNKKGAAKKRTVGDQVRGKARLEGGMLVTPYWLRKSAAEIRARIPKMDESQRAAAERVAARMDAAAEPFPSTPPLPDGWVQMPKGRKYGPLAGAVVRKQIADDLVGTVTTTVGEQGWPQQLYKTLRVAHGVFKWTKTAANPAGQVRNFVSNYMLLALSGTGWVHATRMMARAAQEMRTNGPYWKLAKERGAKASGFANQELQHIEREFLDMLDRQGELNLGRKLKLAAAVVQEKTGVLYQGAEALGKLAKMIDAMEREGLSADAAMILANKTLFDYSEVAPWLKTTRTSPFGLPFITFTAKVMPQLLRTMLDHPLQWAPVVTGSMAMPYILASQMDTDEEEYEKLLKSMPEWIGERSNVYILPMQDAEGRWIPVDLGYFFPWSQWTDALRAAGRLLGPDRDLEDAAQIVQNLGLSGAPLYDVVSVWKTGIDPFTQRAVADEYAPASEKFKAYLTYSWNMAAPSLISVGGRGFLGKTIDAATGKLDSQGRPAATFKEAAGRLVGVNTYAYDAQETRARNIQGMQRELADTKSAMRRRLRNPNNAEDTEAIIELFTEKMRRVQEKLAKYAEESNSELLYR